MKYAFRKDGRLFVPQGTGRVLVGEPPCCPCEEQDIPGACCLLPSNACAQTLESQCLTAGGVFRGPGVPCPPCGSCYGACCLPSTACSLLNPSQCNAQGGTFRGECVACSSGLCTSTCCTPGVNCFSPSPATFFVTISGSASFQPWGGCCGFVPAPWVGGPIGFNFNRTIQVNYSGGCGDVETILTNVSQVHQVPYCDGATQTIKTEPITISARANGAISTAGSWTLTAQLTNIDPLSPADFITATGGAGTSQACGQHSASASSNEVRNLFCGNTSHTVSMNLSIAVSGWATCGLPVQAPSPGEVAAFGRRRGFVSAPGMPGGCAGCGDSLTGGAVLS